MAIRAWGEKEGVLGVGIPYVGRERRGARRRGPARGKRKEGAPGVGILNVGRNGGSAWGSRAWEGKEGAPGEARAWEGQEEAPGVGREGTPGVKSLARGKGTEPLARDPVWESPLVGKEGALGWGILHMGRKGRGAGRGNPTRGKEAPAV